MEWTYTVWDEPKMIYVAIPKVANSAVKSALLRSFVQDKRWANPHDRRMPYEEATPAEIRTRYSDYVTFTVVRNPFDRAVSFWADKIVGAGWYKRLESEGFSLGAGFEETALRCAKTDDATTDPHIRSQHDRVLDGDTMLPDLVLRVENLAQDWETLRSIAAHRSKRPLKPIEVRRSTSHRPWQEYYSQVSESAVAERYRTDFDVLGYAPSIDADPGPAVSGRVDPYRLLDAVDTSTIVIDAVGYDAVRAALVEGAGARYVPAAGGTGPWWRTSDPVRLARKVAVNQRVVAVADAASSAQLREFLADDQVVLAEG